MSGWMGEDAKPGVVFCSRLRKSTDAAANGCRPPARDDPSDSSRSIVAGSHESWDILGRSAGVEAAGGWVRSNEPKDGLG